MEPVVSQEEIDALWNSMFQGGGSETDGRSESQWSEVRQYDFREGSQLSQHDLEAVRQAAQKLARHVEQNLKAYLRSPVQCSLTTVEEGHYGDFLRAIPHKTIIGELECPSLSASILWEVNFNVAFGFVERMMGWPGATSPPDREPSAPELNLLGRVMVHLAEWFGQAAGETVGIRPRFRRILVPPSHVGAMPESQPVVVVGMELGVGDVSGSTTLCIPTEALLPARERLQATPGTALHAKQQDPAVRAQVDAALRHVKVLVRAELGSGEITFGELRRLAEGDVLELNKRVGEHADVLIGSRPRFQGTPGSRGKRLAVEIRQVLGPKRPTH